jgi:DNA-binding HxlR family transcriptional regulator
MKPTPGNMPLSPPEPFLERRLAHKIYAAKSPLQLEVLDLLVRSPGSRYVDLQGFLRGRGDQVLNDTLGKLQEEGLVLQRGFGRKRSTYQLTSLGVAVRDVIVELRAADRISAGAHDRPLPAPV